MGPWGPPNESSITLSITAGGTFRSVLGHWQAQLIGEQRKGPQPHKSLPFPRFKHGLRLTKMRTFDARAVIQECHGRQSRVPLDGDRSIHKVDAIEPGDSGETWAVRDGDRLGRGQRAEPVNGAKASIVRDVHAVDVIGKVVV